MTMTFLDMLRSDDFAAWQAGGSDYEHAQRQKLIAELEQRAAGVGNDLGKAALDASQPLGESVWNELGEIAQAASDLRARILNRDVPPAEGRRLMGALLTRHEQARARKRSFEVALDNAVSILADPVAAGDALWTKYPTTRPRMDV